jgi:SAM-dependent methyltransferase
MSVPPSSAAQPPAYVLSPAEEQRLSAFFAEGRLPSLLEQAIGDYMTRKVGRDWHDPVILERLRRAIVAQKDDYWKPAGKRSLQYTKAYSVLGYLAYHFPVYFMQAEHLFAMLARDGLLKKHMTVLDIGTGPGIVPFAMADFLSRLDGARANVFSLERSEEHIEAFLYLRDRFVPKGGNVSIKPPVRADLTVPGSVKLPGGADLLVFSNVLNEVFPGSVEKRADLVIQYAGLLAPDGTILIVEPAEEAVSTQLRVLSCALKKRGLTVHSPCSYIRDTNCTPDRCWSFVTAPPIRPTTAMQVLASGTEPFRYVNTDIKYSYVVLKKDGSTQKTFRVPPGSRALRLSQIRKHVDRRINVIAAKMSENLGDKRDLIFRICDGTSDIPVYAVLPSFHITPGNEAVVSAPYGTVLRFDGVLVRYNEKHDAVNVLVSRNTVIGNAE